MNYQQQLVELESELQTICEQMSNMSTQIKSIQSKLLLISQDLACQNYNIYDQLYNIDDLPKNIIYKHKLNNNLSAEAAAFAIFDNGRVILELEDSFKIKDLRIRVEVILAPAMGYKSHQVTAITMLKNKHGREYRNLYHMIETALGKLETFQIDQLIQFDHPYTITCRLFDSQDQYACAIGIKITSVYKI